MWANNAIACNISETDQVAFDSFCIQKNKEKQQESEHKHEKTLNPEHKKDTYKHQGINTLSIAQ